MPIHRLDAPYHWRRAEEDDRLRYVNGSLIPFLIFGRHGRVVATAQTEVGANIRVEKWNTEAATQAMLGGGYG